LAAFGYIIVPQMQHGICAAVKDMSDVAEGEVILPSSVKVLSFFPAS
jgi:hypothetical protein